MAQTPIERINQEIRRIFQDALNKNEEVALLYPSDPEFDVYREAKVLAQSVEGYREQIVSQVYSGATLEAAKAVADVAGTSISTDPQDALRYAARLLLQAKMDSSRHLISALTGEPAPPRHQLFVGIEANDLPPLPGETSTAHEGVPLETIAPSPTSMPAGDDHITLEELEKAYIAAKQQGTWNAKTQSDLSYTMRIAYAVIAPATPLPLITDKDVRAVRDLIAQLPPNALKPAANGNASLTEIAKANKGGPTLSFKTQEKRLDFFKGLLKWAEAEGYIGKVPGAKIKVQKAKASADEQRRPYSPEDLQNIFSSPVYTGRLSEIRSNTAGPHIIHDGKFWIPLIALYSGMRLGEIVQLMRADIKVADGIHYFDNRSTPGDEKRFKTQSSIRQVPVHPHLIEIGLLRYASQQPSGGRLFPEISIGKGNYPSTPFSKWWTRYSQDCGFDAPFTAFHSFRHNFIDAMRAVEAPTYVIELVAGHKNTSVNAQYGKGATLSQVHKHVSAIALNVAALKSIQTMP